jgi:micrococcal nuclease
MPGDTVGPIPVTRVVDGDTVVVGGVTLRLIGIDTPETVDPRTTVQCFGREASAYAHLLLGGRSVRLEYDASQGRLDRYGRTLAYVWMPDGRMFNQVMVADGYAHEYTYSVPYRYQAVFIAAERHARDAQLGLWSPSTCNGDTTTPATSAPGIVAPTSRCDPSYPTVCIPPPPPDLDCADVPYRRFPVVGADPHHFDSDHDGIGCES